MNMDLLMCKAIREDYNEWVEGFYRYEKETGRNTVYMVDGGNCVVYGETVCRSTGYRDTNGKMIYEGDLISTESRFADNPLGEVKFGNNYEKDQFVIAYYGGTAWDTLGTFVRSGVEKNYVVVGNIYDHYRP